MGIVVSIVLMYAEHIIDNVFRLFVGLSYLFILLYVIILQYILVQILMKMKLLYIPILLVGAGKTAELVDCYYDRMLINYYKIIGFVDDNLRSVLLDQKYPRWAVKWVRSFFATNSDPWSRMRRKRLRFI